MAPSFACFRLLLSPPPTTERPVGPPVLLAIRPKGMPQVTPQAPGQHGRHQAFWSQPCRFGWGCGPGLYEMEAGRLPCSAILAQAASWQDTTPLSIRQGDKIHPFPQSVLQEVRNILGGASSEVPLAQPVHLDLLIVLSHTKQRHGSHVEEPTWKTSRVWQSKEELRVQSWEEDASPPRQGWDNYRRRRSTCMRSGRPSGRRFPWAWLKVPSPKRERPNAADAVRRNFCPGPFAGIDKSDKIRTIFDGSKNGANEHSQNNTKERDTSPIVMDCVDVIHSLTAAAAQTRSARNGPTRPRTSTP